MGAASPVVGPGKDMTDALWAVSHKATLGVRVICRVGSTTCFLSTWLWKTQYCALSMCLSLHPREEALSQDWSWKP